MNFCILRQYLKVLIKQRVVSLNSKAWSFISKLRNVLENTVNSHIVDTVMN